MAACRRCVLWAFLVTVVVAALGRAQAPRAAPPSRPWFPKAPPLAPPAGQVIRVATVAELYAAARHVEPGGTISLAAGLYHLPRFLELKTDRLTLRGEPGDRHAVVLDGGGIGELIWFNACADVTVADLTIRNVKWNGFKINSQTGVQRLTIRNCVIHNVWQRGVKGVKVPAADRERLRPTGCRIEYCLFYNDRPKRFEDDETDTAATFGGNYIGGIDVMYARGWTISDNVFVGIRGRTGEARGAVFLWHESEDCVVERNIIIDCDSGICLGNSHKPADVPVHARRVIVRNNFITRAHENGLLADYTADCRILHNTVHDPAGRLGRLIRIVHDADGLLVANNLLSGPPIRNESTSRITLRHNVVVPDLSGAFADPDAGDLHVKAPPAGVAEAALPLEEVPDDIDGQPRGPRPDVGADEFSSAAESVETQYGNTQATETHGEEVASGQ